MTDAAPTRRRLRSQPRKRFAPDTTVASPCVNVCWLDEKTGWCEGCKRSGEEIRDWSIMSADQKRAVLAQLDAR